MKYYMVSMLVATMLVSGCEKDDVDNSAVVNTPDSIGVVGCSLNLLAITGYKKLDGNGIWSVNRITSYKGGDIGGWSDVNNELYADRWNEFNKNVESTSPTTVWWLIAPNPPNKPVVENDYTYANVISIYSKIRAACPNATIYASYVPPKAGEDWDYNDNGDVWARELVCRIVGEALVEAGPELTQLSIDQTAEDGYHPNDEGRLVWGNDLVKFFGK